jgi:hypothetical protein
MGTPQLGDILNWAADTQAKPTGIGTAAPAQNTAEAGDAPERQPALLAPIPQGKVAVVDPLEEYKVVLIDEADLPAARANGMRLASPEEIRTQQRKEIYDDLGSKLAVGATNAFDMITYGFGKGLMVAGARAIGGDEAAERVARSMALAEEENPISAAIGTGIGIGAGLLTGGTEELALKKGIEAAAAKRAGIAAVGERAAVSSGTKAVPFFGGATVANLAARASLESALYGAGEAFSEAELGNSDAMAEKLFVGAVKGLLLGAGVGAGLGLGGKAISHLGKLAFKVPSPRALAEKLADTAASLSAQDIRRLENMGIDATKRGSFLLDEPEIAEVFSGFPGRVTEIHAAAKKVVARTGKEIEIALENIETIAKSQGKRPDVRSFLRRAEEEIVRPLDRIPGLEPQVRRVREYLQDYGVKTGVLKRLEDGSLVETGSAGEVSFKDVHEFRQALDSIIFDEVGNIKGGSIAAKGISRTLRNLQEDIFRAGAGEVNVSALKAYEDAAARYHVAVKMEKALAGAATRFEAKSGLGLLEHLAGVGGVMAMGPKGALMALAMKTLRERGPQFAASVLNKAARLSVLKQAAVEVDKDIEKAAKTVVSAKGNQKQVSVTLPFVRRLKKQADHITNVANSGRIEEEFGSHIDHEIAPILRVKYIGAASKAILYLMMTKPRGKNINPAIPGTKTTEPSPHEWAQWAKRLDTVQDPIGTIQAAVQNGTLSKEHIETLDMLYPNIAKQLRMNILQELGKLESENKDPGYYRRIQLGILLKMPTDATMSPEFMKKQQSIAAMPNIQIEQPEYAEPGTMGTTAQVNVRKTRKGRMADLETESQRLDESPEK